MLVVIRRIRVYGLLLGPSTRVLGVLANIDVVFRR
jgi:hypothetical protein